MNKLKTVIEEYRDWAGLSTYIDRIETHIEIDFSHSLENAKALLESVGKEICKKNNVELGINPSVNSVLKKCFSSMGYANGTLVNQVSSALATIAQQVGELRNDIGLTSHGKSLDEIKLRNSKVDVLTREFLIDTVETVCIFIIRNYESKKEKKIAEQMEDTLDYWEAEDFNEFWDDAFGEFSMGDYSYTASDILFNVDKQAYVNEYKVFTENEE
ncbi:abortive infection family protein [Croceimicrobium sp.]|uniref:abortive infection family protein n=1 Tax=Croceimicrobium sp. TaxID=2828340 RepID=UPI003BA8764A